VKILILVLSFAEEPYLSLMRSQQASWDSDSVDDINTVYYYGGSGWAEEGYSATPLITQRSDNCKWGMEMQFNCTDAYYYMSHKLKLALQYIKNWDYDIIFRTNSSSYINKRLLKEFSKTLPTERLYAGWSFVDSEDFGGACVSGAGIFLSRDTAKILTDEIDKEKEIEEDVYIGRILRKHGIEAIDDKSRYDVGSSFIDVPTNRYHYRFKNANRLNDAANMRIVHKLITG
jgi:hypothetical protein